MHCDIEIDTSAGRAYTNAETISVCFRRSNVINLWEFCQKCATNSNKQDSAVMFTLGRRWWKDNSLIC